jgi:hypothetical protein
MLQIKVTIGEAIDRHIILGLKVKAQPENEAVKTEWGLLGTAIVEFRSNHKLDRHILVEVIAREQELARVNEELWRHEDAIRAELAGEFDYQKLVGIAQAIATGNQRRSKLKRSLNAYYGDLASEGKVYGGVPCHETQT